MNKKLHLFHRNHNFNNSKPYNKTKMKIKYIISIIILVLASTGFIGCDLLKKRVEKLETSVYTLNGTGKTGLKIKNISGDIRVSKSNDTLKTIKVTAEKKGKVKPKDLDKPFDNIQINIDSASGIITIETKIQQEHGMFMQGSGAEVSYDIIVPSNMKISVDNANGGLTLDNLGNDIDVQLINGRINFDGCYGNLNINLTNGSVNGNIDSTKGIRAEVVNGSVKLGRMKNVSAEINASTVNGSVKFDDLTLRNVISDKKSVKGTLGDGKNLIRLSCINGSIILSLSDVTTRNDKRKRSGDFEGFQFNFDDDEEDNNSTQKIKIDHDSYKNDKNAYDTLKAAYDSLKNKMKETQAPSAPKAK